MPDEKRASQTGGAKADTAQAGEARKRKQNKLADSMREFEDAHLNYLRDVRDAWNDIQQQCNEAYRKQAQKFYESTATADPMQRFQAQRENIEELQNAVNPDDVRKRFEELYRNHLRALKTAWANLDVDAIEF